jgi:group I intron endonuclease
VYFSKTRLINSRTPIYKAIIKYGYESFELEILEYCEPSILISREQYYIDLLKPEYNILSIAGNSSGYKHTESTMAKFKLRMASDKTRANLAEAASGRILSKEAKTKISLARTGTRLSNETKTKLSNIGAAIRGVPVKITNTLTGEVKQCSTLTLASIALGISRTAIKKAMVSGKVLKKIYLIKLSKE